MMTSGARKFYGPGPAVFVQAPFAVAVLVFVAKYLRLIRRFENGGSGSSVARV